MTTQLPPGPVPDPASLTADWITIWQSELSAMATDRELAETWQRGIALWAQAARAAAALLPGAHERPSGSAAPPRPAAAMAAPDGRDAALEQLASRVAELERRLAELGAHAV